MPVTSTTASAVPYLFTPGDTSYYQALNTDLLTLAQINTLTPAPVAVPSTSTYTIQPTDYLKTISSRNAGGTLTVVVPSVMSSGFMFSTLVFTNNLTVNMTGPGALAWATGNVASTITFTTQFQTATYVSDSGNLYILSSNATIP